MPELPEVETIVRRLHPQLVGQRFAKITVKLPKSLIGVAQPILHQPIAQVTRRAKLIRVHFENQMEMLVHLKMTGQLIFVADQQRLGGGHPTADWVQELPAKHTRLWFELESGPILYFNDQRTFGWCQILEHDQAEQYLSRFGPDIVDPTLTLEQFEKLITRRHVPIKTLLLDSAVTAGIGNIYACDALWEAKINPWAVGSDLTSAQVQSLFDSVRQVMEDGILHQGATISDYRQLDGLSGSYQDVRRVYARQDEACRRCGQPIQRTKQGGRSTFWCSSCQQN